MLREEPFLVISYCSVKYGVLKATHVQFYLQRDFKMGGEEIKAGKYALFTIPEESVGPSSHQTQTNLWGNSGYDAANDVARFVVNTTESDFTKVSTTSMPSQQQCPF